VRGDVGEIFSTHPIAWVKKMQGKGGRPIYGPRITWKIVRSGQNEMRNRNLEKQKGKKVQETRKNKNCKDPHP
jgi:hypothetical protein